MNSTDKKTCIYTKASGENCKEEALDEEGHCLWHSKSIKKNDIEDIRQKLEERCKKDSDLEGFYLPKINLEGSFLMKAKFKNANLQRVNFSRASLYGANFENSNLFKANFDRANLRDANLTGSDMLGVNFEQAKLERIIVGGNNKVRNEREAEDLKKEGKLGEAKEKYLEAEEIYRNLKTNFLVRGLSTSAGVFFYKEMTMKRKQLPRFSVERLWSKMVDVTCGYGEKPFRIITFSLFFMFIHAIIYFLLGISHGDDTVKFSINNSVIENIVDFLDTCYYSVVTFTTLGYGDYSPMHITKLFAIIEAYSGAFLIALFVITVYKNTMER